MGPSGENRGRPHREPLTHESAKPYLRRFKVWLGQDKNEPSPNQGDADRAARTFFIDGVLRLVQLKAGVREGCPDLYLASLKSSSWVWLGGESNHLQRTMARGVCDFLLQVHILREHEDMDLRGAFLEAMLLCATSVDGTPGFRKGGDEAVEMLNKNLAPYLKPTEQHLWSCITFNWDRVRKAIAAAKAGLVMPAQPEQRDSHSVETQQASMLSEWTCVMARHLLAARAEGGALVKSMNGKKKLKPDVLAAARERGAECMRRFALETNCEGWSYRLHPTTTFEDIEEGSSGG